MKCGREKQDQSKPQLIMSYYSRNWMPHRHTHTHTHTLSFSLCCISLQSVLLPVFLSVCAEDILGCVCVCVCVFTCVTLCRCFDLIHPRICFTPQQHDKPLFFILSLSFTHCQTALAGVPEPCVNTHLSPILCYESRRNEFRSHR